MIHKKDFYDRDGLVTAHPDSSYCENAMEFTLLLRIIKRMRGHSNADLNANLNQHINACRVPGEKGLYNQSPHYYGVTGHDRYTSIEQILSIFLYYYNTDYERCLEIWEEVKRQFFRYNNIDAPKSSIMRFLTPKRILQPKIVLLMGYLAGSKICKVLWPLGKKLLMRTMRKDIKVRPQIHILLWSALKNIAKLNFKLFERVDTFGVKKVYFTGGHSNFRTMRYTDGKLMNFLICQSIIRSNIAEHKKTMLSLYKDATKSLIKSPFFKDGWNNVFEIYFQHEDHPIRKLLSDYKIKS